MPVQNITEAGVLLTTVTWDCDGPEGHIKCTEEFVLYDKWQAEKKKEEQSWFDKWAKKLKALFGSDETR